MSVKTDVNQYLQPLSVGGLKGRKLCMPGPRDAKGEVLFIYGHHSSLERWWGVMELIAQHSTVTMPDLPGFGGMESLYKLGKSATIDNLADWLAEFVKQEYGERKVTVVGMSLGFVIITRMLQRHPELTKNVGKLISLFGFAHKRDFIMPNRLRRAYKLGAWFFSLPASSAFYRRVFLHPEVLRRGYHKTKNAREKFKGLSPEEVSKNMDFEIALWHANDLRTHMKTVVEFLSLDNTKSKVNLPVYHIGVKNDRYFSNSSVEKHYRQIFSEYHLLAELKSGTHAPTAVRTAKDAQAIIPAGMLANLRS